MNYIQILYLCILKQQWNRKWRCCYGCELHSNLVSLHSETTRIRKEKADEGCELHSNLVSLHSETTAPCCLPLFSRLWITFKSCIFAFWNNDIQPVIRLGHVVNYIQILYLCILKQLLCGFFHDINRCELHSNLVSLHSETTSLNTGTSNPGCELHSNLVSLHSETTPYPGKSGKA